jgi:uncharacterized repeat protein (TIGR01451 family)
MNPLQRRLTVRDRASSRRDPLLFSLFLLAAWWILWAVPALAGEPGGAYGPAPGSVAHQAAGPLALTKTVQLGSEPIRPGDALTYTIVVANAGPGPAAGVVVSDTLPAYLDGSDLLQVVDIPAGQSVTFTLAATLAPQAPAGRTITNTASFSHTLGSGQDSVAFSVAGIAYDSRLYLPLVVKNYQQVPPTISNARHYFDVNGCYLPDEGLVGTLFDVYFDYVDANGDVLYGINSGPVDGYATITFFPTHQTGPIDFDEYSVYGYAEDGDPTRGTINLDTLCVVFEESTGFRLTFVLKDRSGLESNPLSLDVPRPAGAD